MATDTQKLSVVQQVRSNIAPGVSGWVILGNDESKALRELLNAAMIDLSIDPNSADGVEISNDLYDMSSGSDNFS